MRWDGVALRLNALLTTLPFALAASAADARFLPPEGKPLRQVLTEERIEAGASQRYVSEREIIFMRTPDGYRADVMIVSESHAADDAGAMFGAGLAALKGQTIRFELDRNGTIVAIADEEALWGRFCDAIEGMARGKRPLDAQRARNVAALVAPLRTMPPARRRALLGSMITAIIAGPRADRQPGTQPITLPARDATGPTIDLPGTEAVTLGNGALTIESTAEGDLNPSAHLIVKRRERVDAARGLILETRTQRDTIIGTGATSRRSQSTVTSVIAFKVF
ncbi:MAG: hypothetical protein K2W81_08885 [Sphingomonas sp.]|uniref:hypothetical protein n=1 Tax=Sphingomonas sp. TaxID=28214 RepID=UPI0025D16F19|nr:hypothetical protein [Sphingomonas sp.]MBY0284063.1 hypothetical protein [Sphingomonas sp.]